MALEKNTKKHVTANNSLLLNRNNNFKQYNQSRIISIRQDNLKPYNFEKMICINRNIWYNQILCKTRWRSYYLNTFMISRFGWVLWHINHCRLFNAKSSLYIWYMICKYLVCREQFLNQTEIICLHLVKTLFIWFVSQ